MPLAIGHLQELMICRTNLSRCPSNDLPTSLQPIHLRLLDLLEERGWSCELDKQLKFEYQSLQILMTLSQAWRELERVTTPSIIELRKGNLATLEAEMKLSELRTRLWREEGKSIRLASGWQMLTDTFRRSDSLTMDIGPNDIF